MSDHTLKSYDTELRELRAIVARMGGLAEEQLVLAFAALKTLDLDAARQVRDSDRILDDLEHQAERAAMMLFARRAPVADDLREIVCIVKMTMLIERMGDYAKNIARRTLPIAQGKPLDLPDILEKMTDEARYMIQGAIDSFIHRDAGLAVRIWAHDEIIDNLHNAANQSIITGMMERPSHLGSLAHLLMISKNLERVGDQATNIAEQVYYALRGGYLDRNRPQNDVTREQVFASAGTVTTGSR